jgi:hypothetical protein
MDKKTLEIISLKEKDSSRYWKSKSYIERLVCIEEMRKYIFNYDSSAERLQRVLTITSLKKH